MRGGVTSRPSLQRMTSVPELSTYSGQHRGDEGRSVQRGRSPQYSPSASLSSSQGGGRGSWREGFPSASSHGVPGSSGGWRDVSASSHHTGRAGVRKPQWISAVQRIQLDAARAEQRTLPPDVNAMGLPSRERQGVLTARSLRAFEENGRTRDQHPFPSNRELYNAVSSGATGSPVFSTPDRTFKGLAMPTGRALSERSAGRRARIRATAQPTGGNGSYPSESDRSNTPGGAVPTQIITTQVERFGGPPPLASGGPPSPLGVTVSEQSGHTSLLSGWKTGLLGSATAVLPAKIFSKLTRAIPPTPTTEVATVSKGVHEVSEEECPSTVPNDKGGVGGDGPPTMRHRTQPRPTRSDAENSRYRSKAMKQAMMREDDEERDERQFRARDIAALHAIPWEQRRQLPMDAFGTRFFSLLATPRFWEKLDWTFRASLLTVLPTMVLSLEPATMGIVPDGFASSFAFFAFWITMPTFGSGLHELVVVLKGFAAGLVMLCIVIGVRPGPDWLSILLLFVLTFCSSFISEECKKTAAYVIASTISEYINQKGQMSVKYAANYYMTILIAMAFAVAGFVIPFIRWSSWSTCHYIRAMGHTLSISVQGICSSFWAQTPLAREMNMVRIRQLHITAEKCMQKASASFHETNCEPHTARFRAQMRVRLAFCCSIYNILTSMGHVVELIADNPAIVDTPLCIDFGAAIVDDLAIISASMDSMILKIVDFQSIVTPAEISYFREARERFQDAVSRVREDVILTNENYATDESDVFLGFYMFSVDELCDVIANFKEEADPGNSLLYALAFPRRDILSVIGAFQSLWRSIYYHGKVTRRFKEAVKLSLCMTVPMIFQVFALSNSPTSSMAGAAIIALVYNPTGSESFHYASGRLLGTVLGSLLSLMCVQIADGTRWILYIFIGLLSIVGAYVQAAPGFYALGNAIVCSTISIMTQYKDSGAAMTRINQNCFAILIYFCISCVLWPVRAHTRVRMGLNTSLRCLRESATRLLRNLDMPPNPLEVTSDVSALLKEMRKKVDQQARFIPGAIEEPTMLSAEYPEDQWKHVVSAERKVHSTLSMMLFAYHTFMSSVADVGKAVSVHWVVLHRIAPHAQDLADLIHATVDLHLLSLSKTSDVPTTHLTRLRAGMMEAQQDILATYIRTLQRKMEGDDDDDEDEENSEVFHSGSGVNLSGPDSGSSTSPRAGGSTAGAKRTGYLSYGMTESEAAALRMFVSSGVAPQHNASFHSQNMVLGNSTFAATRNTNDVRMYTHAGNDDKLLDEVRRKHSKMITLTGTSGSAQGPSESVLLQQGKQHNATDAPGDLLEVGLQKFNKSFGNNSFFGNLLRRKSVKESFPQPALDGGTGEKAKTAGSGGDGGTHVVVVDHPDGHDAMTQSKSFGSPANNTSRGDAVNPSSFVSFFAKKKPVLGSSVDDEGTRRESMRELKDGAETGVGDEKSVVDVVVHIPEGENSRPATPFSAPLHAGMAEETAAKDNHVLIIAPDEGGSIPEPRTGLLDSHGNVTAAISISPLSATVPAASEFSTLPTVAMPDSTVEGVTKDPSTLPPVSEPAMASAVSTHDVDDGTLKTHHVMEAKDLGAVAMQLSHPMGHSGMDSSSELGDVPGPLHPSRLCGGLLSSGSEGTLNFSFFDAEKGEFILTNHDIHSLEAFLFGTRALVVYMNELQNAIIEMQHAKEIAKKL